MIFGRVRGVAISTLKYPQLEGYRLLVVQPLNKRMQPTGPLQVAVDTVEAQEGVFCVMVRSREAALSLPGDKFVPVDLSIIGLVDELEVRPDGEFDFTLKEGQTQYT